MATGTLTRTLTHSQLLAEITAGTLHKGESITISDYATKHNIQDGNTFLAEIHTEIIEPLLVNAISNNKLDVRAKSVLFPKDVIHYDVADILCEDVITARTGKITYRKDHLGNETHYDFKGVVFRRWKFDLSSFTPWVSLGTYTKGDKVTFNNNLFYCIKTVTGSTDNPETANFNYVTDNQRYLSWQTSTVGLGGDPVAEDAIQIPVSSTSMDFYTFSDATGAEKSEWFKDVLIGQHTFYNSIVFVETNSDQTFSVSFKSGCYFMTFGNGNYSNTFGNDNSSNTFGNYNSSNTFGNSNYYNTFGNDNYSNTFGNDNSSNTFGNNSSNTFGNNNYSNTFGNSNSSNTFGNSNSYNTFGNDNSNTFGNGNYSNTFGNGNSYNTFGNNNYSNTFGNDNYSNTFGNGNSYNTFGNGNPYNTFGNSNSYNTFGNDNPYNTFGNGNSYNTFGNGNYSNTFGNSNYYNTFGNLDQNNVFTSIIIIKNTFKNDVTGTEVDYRGATHLVGDYDCEISRRADGTAKLMYINNSDVVTVVNAND
jgi:hypothetical protein